MTDLIKTLSQQCCFGGRTIRFYSEAEHIYRLTKLYPPHLQRDALVEILANVYDCQEDWTYEPTPEADALYAQNALFATEYRDLLPHVPSPYPDITPLDIDLAYPSGSPEIWERRLSNMIRDLLHDH